MNKPQFVYLQCLKIENKLRVRIISSNYLQNLNCKFPRNIRIENQIYKTAETNIKLCEQFKKNFYSVNKRYIELVDSNNIIDLKNKIYTDSEENACCICLCDEKHYVFVTCGHYYVCKSCFDNNKLENCPICRSAILTTIPFKDIRF